MNSSLENCISNKYHLSIIGGGLDCRKMGGGLLCQVSDFINCS